jgi:acetyl-CoA synthetase
MDDTPRRHGAHRSSSRPRPRVLDPRDYEEMYRRSIDDADAFWAEQAREYLTWDKEWDFVLRHDVEKAKVEWFGGGLLNASSNCLDRHPELLKDKPAFYWEGDDPNESAIVTYKNLYSAVNAAAAALKSRGIGKGDRVILCLPRLPELPIAMLACARIGAVHAAVSVELGIDSLTHRIRECGAKAIVIADGYRRAGRTVPLRAAVDDALRDCPSLETILVVNRCGLEQESPDDRDVAWEEAVNDLSLGASVPPEPMAAEDPLFILFAARSTGKPKGLVHTHGGFLLWAAMTTQLIFDTGPDETFWCTSDVDSISGHCFSVYGSLLNGLSGVLFEGVPGYPDYGRYWSIVEKFRVDKLCTEPSTIRALAPHGENFPERYNLSSLKILGSAGKPMPSEIWQWYHRNVGRGRCQIMNTWSQTETGGPAMTPLPGTMPMKPGAVSAPFLGIKPVILDLDTGEKALFPNQEGAFFLGGPWPGMARTVFGDHQDFKESYFAPLPGLFITGESAKRDDDGVYWITGRIDDVIAVANHRVGVWELETALMFLEQVNEAAVVGFPHPLKGQGLYAFVTLGAGVPQSEDLKEELKRFLKNRIGSMAVPEVIQFADALPKTRGGKVLRRLLQKIASGQVNDLGDMITVANPEALEWLIKDRLGSTG